MSNNMNALQQYIDLYTEHRQAVEANSPAALNAHRPAALAALADARLPRKGQDDYEATDLEAVFAPDYGVNLGRVDFDINTTEVAASRHVISVGNYDATNDTGEMGAIDMTSSFGTMLDGTSAPVSDNAWYTLEGIRLAGKPTAKGLYVNRGRIYIK